LKQISTSTTSTDSSKGGASALRGRGPAGSAAGALLSLLLIGYFEDVDAERAIAWRAADSFAIT